MLMESSDVRSVPATASSHRVVINTKGIGLELTAASMDWLRSHGSEAVVANPRYGTPNLPYGPTLRWWEPQVLVDQSLTRHDPLVVQLVEELGPAASPRGCLQVRTVEGPYLIDSTTGVECLMQPSDINWVRIKS
ncbi:hypothetical protein [Synechococcus sp. EJ6-Ellesmere]|uniref:hypothetical protein n=1 Tax=Synechococcus sp. EJ6-Ellesmere TaxID=2823734 RepID=UPI0020CF607D|nr:hypothetical protein [Synechococcus sp. EJ6-Ellesmere]MCP9825942.1 hypothetical protein [Synechococcus sp. EJ6-Ellesmere]